MQALEKVVYTAFATATGGRDGRATSNDNKLDAALSVPKEMGGKGMDKKHSEIDQWLTKIGF